MFGRPVNQRHRQTFGTKLRTLLAASLAAALSHIACAETVRPRAAPDGATLLLGDGRELRLEGLLVPPAGLRFPGDSARRLGEQAQIALAQLAVGRDLVIEPGALRRDRYGRLLVEPRDTAGRLLQAVLLAQGWARFDPGLEPPRQSGEMYTAERAARDRHRGLWNNPVFRVRRPDELGRALDDFVLVSGTVAAVERAGTRMLVRFAPDPKRAASLVIDAAARRRFRDVGYDLPALVGQRIRARGWVERQGEGMVIPITQPLQIERLTGVGEL